MPAASEAGDEAAPGAGALRAALITRVARRGLLKTRPVLAGPCPVLLPQTFLASLLPPLPQFRHPGPSLSLAWTLPLTQPAKASVRPLLLLGQRPELRLEPLCLR